MIATTEEASRGGIKVWDGRVMIDDARVITADVEASNGVIHVINKVILPDM